MKIIRKSLLNLIYILFILIFTLSCSNNELTEDEQKSITINELNNAQSKIIDLTKQIEILQNQITKNENKTNDLESLLLESNQDLKSAENIIIKLSQNNTETNNDSVPPAPPSIKFNPVIEKTDSSQKEPSVKIEKIAPAPKVSEIISKVRAEAEAKAKKEADDKAKAEKEADDKAKAEKEALALAEKEAELEKTNILIADCKNNYNLANYTEALSKCIELANKNNNYGHRIIALMYLNGYGVNKNISKANEIFFNIANSGDIWSLSYLAEKAFNNNDYVNAVKWYNIGSELDDLDSIYNLGLHYYKGLGVNQDFQESFSYFKKAADKEHSDSQFYIGKFYHIGNGAYFGSPASKNFFEALKWYELAANQNNHKAQNHIGILHYLGDGDSSFKGFKADAKKSLKWFKLAINNGSESAETNAEIAQSYLYGRDDKRIAELILD